MFFQLDDYQDRLGCYPEEDEDENSDEDNNCSRHIKNIAANQLQGKAFRMKVMNY